MDVNWVEIVQSGGAVALAVVVAWQLGLFRKSMDDQMTALREEAHADRVAFINQAKLNGEKLAVIEERTRSLHPHGPNGRAV